MKCFVLPALADESVVVDVLELSMNEFDVVVGIVEVVIPIESPYWMALGLVELLE